jgi:hemerythrin-like domain-containing protein
MRACMSADNAPDSLIGTRPNAAGPAIAIRYAQDFGDGDRFMRDPVLDQLHQDHLHMATILDLIARELDAVEQGATLDLELFEDALTYITAYPDTCHHPTEDVVFERLGSAMPGARSEIDGLQREHVRLIASGRELLDTVRAVEEDALVTRADLLAKGRAYVDVLRAHMNREESGLFRLADEHLGDADWAFIGTAVGAMEDPLFGPAVSADHRRLWQRITAHSPSLANPSD